MKKAALSDDAMLQITRQVLARFDGQLGALLPILHAIQQVIGHIPALAVPVVAEALQRSRAEIQGVISFYPHFRQTPTGRHVLEICRAEACQAMGGEALSEHARQQLGCEFHATRSDGAVTLEPVYCLGLCAQSPALMLDGQPHARMDAGKLDALLAERALLGRTVARDMKTLPPTVAGVIPVPTAVPSPVPVLYVPRDAAALAVGAEAVVQAIELEAARRQQSLRIVRNGSRGLLWLEPLVEVQTARGRVAWGPVQAQDVPSLFDADWLCLHPSTEKAAQKKHPLYRGLTDAIPYLKNQQRLTFARVGIIDPLDLADFEAHGGLAGWRRALDMAPQDIVAEVTASGLRGRGGAAFPTGIKWNTVLNAPSDQKYICCNADEGDSGTFSDRLLMEGDPFTLLEGMAIAALAVGATRGYIYLRSEYPHAAATLNAAIQCLREAGWLGSDIAGSGRAFEVDVRVGAGAYICGEETSMLESLEGKRGQVRAKPPLPAIEGLFGKPTVVNNVISLATVPVILARGAAHYRDFGMGRSQGTLPFQLAGNLKRGGLVERAFGVTLRELLFEYGGGSASGRPLRAVQMGGPLGAYLPESQWDEAIDYERYAAMSAMVGHGGIVAFDDSVDMAHMAQYAMHFCAVESCGKCTPCRIGSTRGVELVQKIRNGHQGEHQGGHQSGPHSGPQREQHIALLRDLCDTMLAGSLCALGGMTPYPVLSALNHFGEDFFGPDFEQKNPVAPTTGHRAPAAAHA